MRPSLTVPLCLLFFLFMALPGNGRAANIENSCTFSFTVNGEIQTKISNTTSVPVKERTPATISFKVFDKDATTQHALSTTSYQQPDDSLTALGNPIQFGQAIDLSTDLPLRETLFYRSGTPAFIILTDLDQNLDPLTKETVYVRLTIPETGDQETLLLTEEGPDSGTFAGYIQINTASPQRKDGMLSVVNGAKLSATYRDAYDSADVAVTAAIVNPTALVFDSSTGAALSGARIRLVNADDGSDALVYGDDGLTQISAITISGTNGVEGSYSYPVVPPGTYRLEVIPPEGYLWSSSVNISTLQQLPNAPFALSDGSFGQAFSVTAASTFKIDLPLDPTTDQAFIVKNANKDAVSIGEFVRYTIEVTNPNPSDMTGVNIVDLQPCGFRYEPGSSQLNNQKTGDPAISTDGRELRYSIGTLPAGESITLHYVARTTVNCKEGHAINTATLTSNAGNDSFSATARVYVYNDMNPDATLIGRVAIAPCTSLLETETPSSGQTNRWEGVPGVRIYMENGAYVVTDKDGLYHFEGVKPGTHVLQLDLETLPEGLEPVALPNSRFAGRAYSQFVEVQSGTLWRADFAVQKVAPPESTIRLQLTTADDDKTGLLDMMIYGQEAPVNNLKIIIVLPDDVDVKTDAITLDGQPFQAEQLENMLTLRLTESTANWQHRIRISTPVNDTSRTNEYKAMVLYDWGTHRNKRLPLLTHRAKLNGPVTTDMSHILPKPDAPHAQETVDQPKQENYSPAWIEQLKPGFEWIEPGPTDRPAMPVANIGIKHDPAETVKLYINNQEVEPLYFEGRFRNRAKTLSVSYWRAVRLSDGWNQLVAHCLNEAGNIIHQSTNRIYYAGAPITAEYIEEGSTLLADGRTVPTIRVRLLDQNGEPARQGLVGTYSVAHPYQPYVINRGLDHAVTMLNDNKPRYEIGSNGIAELKLEPTTTAGEATLLLPIDQDRDAKEIKAWLKAPLRDWILVGFAEGTAGYAALNDNMESCPKGTEDGYYDDGQIAFFAKGRIKGDYLMTIAFDSAKETTKNSLFQEIDPDTYYTLYGDETQQGYEAASTKKLFLKIEKETFQALFGDFDTQLTVTELGRYNRSMTGYKSEYRGNRFEYNAFASETAQGFQKDEIAPNGTSGLYHLSAKSIVYNSEKIVIETRDRFHSEIIVRREELTRHTDYNIDYRAGTLYFKKPIPSRDTDFNHNVIVADYEIDFDGEASWTYGARAAVKPLENLEIGATAIREGQPQTTDSLYAADATLELTKNTELRAEIASSEVTKNTTKGPQNGLAGLLELEHETVNTYSRIYYRNQSEDFGLRQQSAGQAGTEKYGFDSQTRLMTNITVNAEVYHQKNLSTDATRDVAEADLTYEKDRIETRLGLLHATDRFSDAPNQRSDQVLAGVEYELFKNKMEVRLDRYQSIGGRNANADFPTRTILGADYALTQAARLFTEYEMSEGQHADTHNMRIGAQLEPWQGGTLNSSLGQEIHENGPRTFSNLGLNQTINLTEKWSIDAGADMAQTVHNGQNNTVYPNQPPASGTATEDFWSCYIGTGYQEKEWSWAQRIEHLWGENSDKLSYVSGIIGQVQPRLSMSLSSAIYHTDGNTEDQLSAEIRYGLAYRPLESDWMLLNRLDLIYDQTKSASSSDDAQRIVNQFNANWHPNHTFQASLRYGFKYNLENFSGDNYDSFIDLYGLEARYDLTAKWDIGYQLLALHSWNGHETDYATGPSIGYNLANNIWISLGYNISGFYDQDFSAANYTSEGPYLRFRMKFDQDSIKNLNSILKTITHR